MSLRADLALIGDLVRPGARVLDLGCGDGQLLAWLQANKRVNGYGVEIDPESITRCIGVGVNVLERDIDERLSDFDTNGFDIVVMTETLQNVREPAEVLEEMLRIAPDCIVTFPNFGHWRCRLYLATQGRMPMTSQFPHEWYDTPNIHLCTFADFEALCRERGIGIRNRLVVDRAYRNTSVMNTLPNLFGTIAIYWLTREMQ